MEFIPVVVSLFFIIGWSIALATQQAFATVLNRNIVVWWWAAFFVALLTDISFWNLVWVMPATAILNLIAGLSVGGIYGFLLGGIPVFILLLIS